MREHVGKFGAQFQQMSGPGEFDVAVRPMLREAFPIGILDRRQHGGAFRKIHRPPVIGVDQRQIPELRSLIEIGHARHRRLQRDLTERIQRAQ